MKRTQKGLRDFSFCSFLCSAIFIFMGQRVKCGVLIHTTSSSLMAFLSSLHLFSQPFLRLGDVEWDKEMVTCCGWRQKVNWIIIWSHLSIFQCSFKISSAMLEWQIADVKETTSKLTVNHVRSHPVTKPGKQQHFPLIVRAFFLLLCCYSFSAQPFAMHLNSRKMENEETFFYSPFFTFIYFRFPFLSSIG